MEANFIYSEPRQTLTEQMRQTKNSLKAFASQQIADCTLSSLKKEGEFFGTCIRSQDVSKAGISALKIYSKTTAMPWVLSVRQTYRIGKKAWKFLQRSAINSQFPFFRSTECDEDTLIPFPKTEREIALNKRICNSRDLIREGIFETTELQEKRRKLSIALREAHTKNEICDEFYKGAKEELKKFDEDFVLGKEELLKNLDIAYKMAVEMNQRSLEFYKFINDNNVALPQRSIDTVHQALNAIEDIYQNNQLSGNRKQCRIFSLRGYERMEIEQLALIENLKQAAYENATKDERKEIDLAVVTIKKYLTHDLEEEENYPEKNEVLNAYIELEKVLKTPRGT